MLLSESACGNSVPGCPNAPITRGRNAKRGATEMWREDGFRARLFGIQEPVFRQAESRVNSIFNGIDAAGASRVLSLDGAKNHSTT